MPQNEALLDALNSQGSSEKMNLVEFLHQDPKYAVLRPRTVNFNQESQLMISGTPVARQGQPVISIKQPTYIGDLLDYLEPAD